MQRRRFLLHALGGAVASRAFAADRSRAQPPKMARVGVLLSSTEFNFGPSVKVFREALKAAGWVEGQNLALEVRYPGGRYTKLPEIAAELVKLKVDVIASMGSPATLAAKQATTSIPIVMESLSDVVGTGLVSNLARPGGNVTGVSGFAAELSGKRVELVREMLPRADRIGVLVNRGNPATVPVLRATESAAQQARVALHVVDIAPPPQLGPAFEAMKRAGADALIIVADPLLFAERLPIIQLAARHALPAVYELRIFPEIGGLLSYGPLPRERFERMAVYVDRILRGARPADLPIEQPSKFELVINLKTARTLGLTIPPSLLARADQLIE